MKYIRQESQHLYTLNPKRGFFDVEFPVSPEIEERAVEIEKQYAELYEYLKKCYQRLRGGGRIDDIEVPACLEKDKVDVETAEVPEGASGEKRPNGTDTEARSSSTSQSGSKKKGSSSSTNQRGAK